MSAAPSPAPETVSYPFTFSENGWTPGIESIDQARARIRTAFQRHLRREAATWERERDLELAGGGEAALSEPEQEELRLLAIRQAHARMYPDLADDARRFRRRLELTAGGESLPAGAITPEEARRKVKKAAEWLKLKRVRQTKTGRRLSPKSRK